MKKLKVQFPSPPHIGAIFFLFFMQIIEMLMHRPGMHTALQIPLGFSLAGQIPSVW